MNTAAARRALIALLVTGCAKPTTTTSTPPSGPPPAGATQEVRAQPVAPESAAAKLRRYRVDGLPRGHEFAPGRVVGLFAGAELVAAAEVVGASDAGAELVALYVDEGQEDAALRVGEPPPGPQLAGTLATVTAAPDLHRVRIDAGAQDDVAVGDLYSVRSDDPSRGRTIGLVQVIEAGDAGATAEILQGDAPIGARLVFAGVDVARRPTLKLLVARFHGPQGAAIARALEEALRREVGRPERPDIEVEALTDTIAPGPDAEAQATRLGEKAGADVVVWGEAGLIDKGVAILPRLTLIGASAEGDELFPAARTDLARALRGPEEQRSRQVQGLASYVVGLIYGATFDRAIEPSPVRAAAHLEASAAGLGAVEAYPARMLQLLGLSTAGDWAGAELAARAVERGAEQARNDQLRVLAAYGRTILALDVGELTTALAGAEELLRLHDKLGQAEGRAEALDLLVDIRRERGELDEALRLARKELLPILESLQDTATRAEVLRTIADIHAERGEHDAALRVYTQEALPLYDAQGDRRGRAEVLERVAELRLERKQPDEALRLRRRELHPLYEALGDRPARARNLGAIAEILRQKGQLAEALRIREKEQLPAYKEAGDLRGAATTLIAIARLHAERKAYDPAIRSAREALAILTRLDERDAVYGVEMSLALYLLQRGGPNDREEAKTIARRILPRLHEDDPGTARKLADIVELPLP